MDCSLRPPSKNPFSSPLQLQTNSYHHKLYPLAPHFVFGERQQQFTAQAQVIDAFGPSWVFGIAHIKTGQLSVSRKGSLIPLSGHLGFFLPPFSVVSWHISPSLLQWSAFMSELPLPQSLPQCAVAFPWQRAELPISVNEIIEYLLKVKEFIAIEKIEQRTVVAAKVKSAIEQCYMKEVSISDVAQRLYLSRVVMGKKFKLAYGLTPLEYRNHLRVIHALRLLREGYDVTTAAFESGFGHISQFNRVFRRQVLATPRECSTSQMEMAE